MGCGEVERRLEWLSQQKKLPSNLDENGQMEDIRKLVNLVLGDL